MLAAHGGGASGASLSEGHYYAEGPPADPKMTLEFLLKRGKDPASAEFAIMQAATRQLGRPYRMTEGNSCFHGGKPLVSDTLASGLWSGDYMLQVAQAGYIGVNLHGGGNGLDTPIAGDTAQGFVARPVFCGMLLAQSLAGSTFVESNLSASDSSQNVTAFASRSGAGRMRLAIFNKASAPMKIRMALGCAVTPRFTLRYVVRQNVCWQNEKVCAMCGEPTSHS